jgi:hypothetical protein
MNSSRTPKPHLRLLSTALTGAAVLVGSSSQASASASHEIPSALVITKSSNRNQVNYAVVVDDACAPTGPSPVRVYWRMLEHGVNATEPLQADEQRAFGIVRQGNEGGVVNLLLKGMPGRAITIRTARAANGTCSASATMTIAGVAAHIEKVHVQQSLFGVDYVLLAGRSAAGGPVTERVTP